MLLKIFKLLRNLLAVIGLLSILAGGFGAYLVAKSYNLPPQVFIQKALKKIGMENSAVAAWVRPDPVQPEGLVLPDLNDPHWTGHGARFDRELLPVLYDQNGYPIPESWLSHGHSAKKASGQTRSIIIDNVQAFRSAIKKAEPGDVITLQPGVYRIKSRNIEIMRGGTIQQPILVQSEKLGEVVIELDSQEGFWVNAPYWTFENIEFKGITKNHDYGEHAFHVVGGGHGFVLRNSRLHEFNAMIKGNGHRGRDGETRYPDGVLIENNHFFNSEIRRTSNPVTFIDVVGADNWIVRGNLIADYAKGEGDRISYAAFLKGNSSHGVFENNLVIGEYRTTGGVRVGLSLGGGGTGKQYFRDGNSNVEHSHGIVRNNIMMYCSDVGLYLNKAHDTKVYNNTFYRTMGLDIRFQESSADIYNNLLSSRIKERDGGVSEQKNNLVEGVRDFKDWFVNPDSGNFKLLDGEDLIDKGITKDSRQEDFCGRDRSSAPDLGAVEFDKGPSDCVSVFGL